MTVKSWIDRALGQAARTLEWFLEYFGTFLYREMLKRNTLQPMQEIIDESDPDKQWQLVREWAHTKANECSYIQLASGFLFTTVSSCLQWPGVQNGHWSASALMYASILLSLIAVVSGSQQLLVLPSEKRSYERSETDNPRPLAQQVPAGMDFSGRKQNEPDEAEKRQLRNIAQRFRYTLRDDHPNFLHVFALQAPIMLLSLAVVAFLSGLCSVVFAPLARQLIWNDDAKIAVVFGVVAILAAPVFMLTSFLIHGLFSLQEDPQTRVGSFLIRIKA